MDMSIKIPFGELLAQLRKRQKMSQGKLASQLGMHRNTISLWERGEYLPETFASMLELAKALYLTDQETQTLLEARFGTASLLAVHNIPFQRNPYFTGRERELQILHEGLRTRSSMARPVAICGLGGTGKTQLALEYAYRYRESYHNILWATAESSEALFTSFVQLAILLNLPEQYEQDQQRAVSALKRWLTMHKDWLLIIDNIEDLALINAFVPASRQGNILLTARLHVAEPLAQTLLLESLAEEEGALLLLRRANLVDFYASREIGDVLYSTVREIVRGLGGLPLALDQAGAYVLETGCDLAGYLLLLQRRQADLLKRRGSMPVDHPESVSLTFALAFEQVNQRNPAALDLLRFCAFLAPDAIPEEVITESAQYLGPTLTPIAADPFTLNEAIAVLHSFSLVRRDAVSKTLAIHRLVQAVLRQQMDEQAFPQWLTYAIQAINAVFPQVEYDTWIRCQRYLVHVQTCSSFLEQGTLFLSEALQVLDRAGLYLIERARYADAAALLQKAFALHERIASSQPEDLVEVQHHLALLTYRQGRYVEAEQHFQQALSICEQRMGSEHLLVARILNNYAELAIEQGKYQWAESLIARALSLRQRLLGEQDPDTATCLETLALLRYRQGMHGEAEVLLQQALQIHERVLGCEHPKVVSELGILAEVYRFQGHYAQAESLALRVLDRCEQLFGLIYPNTAQNLYILAQIYLKQGLYDKAEETIKRAFIVCRQLWGPHHPVVAHCLCLLAEVYQQQGKMSEAQPLLSQALEVYEHQSGSPHPSLVNCLNLLASLALAQGKTQEAEVQLQRALTICEGQMGLERLETARCLDTRAWLARERGEYSEAEALLIRAIAIKRQAFGQQHVEISNSLHALATLYQIQGKRSQAEVLYHQVVTLREQQLGVEHPDTRQTRAKLQALQNAAIEPDLYVSQEN